VWCRVTIVGPGGDELACGVLRGSGAPDLATVDGIARLALAAGRLGGAMSLAQVSPALSALLELTGLRIQVEREPESRDQPLWVQRGQEERHAGDLPP
jgi:hypothetical protein